MMVARPVSLARRDSVGMINLGSIASLQEHGHALAAYCQHCDHVCCLAETQLGSCDKCRDLVHPIVHKALRAPRG